MAIEFDEYGNPLPGAVPVEAMPDLPTTKEMVTVSEVQPVQPDTITLSASDLIAFRNSILSGVKDMLDAERAANAPPGPAPDVWVPMVRDQATKCPTCRMPQMVYLLTGADSRLTAKTRVGCNNPMCPDSNPPEAVYHANG